MQGKHYRYFIMKENQLILCVTSDNHDLSESDFWLGFMVYHSTKNAEEGFKLSATALEITSLGLNVNKRQKGAFRFPIEIRNRLRLDPEVMFQYLLDIADIDEAFEEYKPVHRVDFHYSCKNKLSIAENHGKGNVCFITDAGNKTVEIKQPEFQYSALSWQIATGINRKIQLDIQTQIYPIKEWTGDMESYLSYLNYGVIESPELFPTETQQEIIETLVANDTPRKISQAAQVLSKKANTVLEKSSNTLYCIFCKI